MLKRGVVFRLQIIENTIENALVRQTIVLDQMRLEKYLDDLLVIGFDAARGDAGENQWRRDDHLFLVVAVNDFLDELISLNQRQRAELELIGIGNVRVVVARCRVHMLLMPLARQSRAGQRRLISGCVSIGIVSDPLLIVLPFEHRTRIIGRQGRRKRRMPTLFAWL